MGRTDDDRVERARENIDGRVAEDGRDDPGPGRVDVVLALSIEDDELVAEEEDGELRAKNDRVRTCRSRKTRGFCSSTHDDAEVVEGGRLHVAERLERLDARRGLGRLEEDEADDDADAADEQVGGSEDEERAASAR